MTEDRIKGTLTPQGHMILSEEAKATIQRHFEKGDKRALFEMLYWCAAMGLILPDWAAMAINKAYWRYDKGALDSWEDVFGKPFPGKSKKKALTDSHALAVQMEVRRIVGRERCAIDEYLFERVAKSLKIGKRSTVSKLYYDYYKTHPALPALRSKKRGAKE